MKGCCLGCLAVGVLFVVLLIVGVVVTWRIAATFYEPVPLAEVYGDTHAVMIMVDLYAEKAQDLEAHILNQPAENLSSWMPYGATLFLDVDKEQGRKELTVAVSTKRYGRIISWFLPDPEDLAQEIGLGEEFGLKELEFQDNGVFVVSATSPISDEALQEARERWPSQAAPAMALEGGHLLEIVLDNTAGHAYLALESLLEDLESGDDEDADEPTLGKEDWESLLQQMTTLRLTSDVVDDETLEFVVDVQCASREAAEEVLEILNLVRKETTAELEDEGVLLDGAFLRTGREIHGNFTLTGFDEAVADYSQDALRNFSPVY